MFIRAANPIWYFVDLVGNQLDDSYYIFFLENVSPYDPQSVFQDPDGTIPWSFPLQFNPNGTLPDNLYFDDTLVYRIEIRMGNSQTDTLVYEIDNFVPGGNGEVIPGSDFATTDNQISNGQFFEISFTSPLSIDEPGTYDVAPGWQLILTGSGICTVTQHTYDAMDQQINNPPFALEINTNGWTTANLVQRFNNNGGLWTSVPSGQVGAVLGSMTVLRASPSSYALSMQYRPSSGSINNLIIASGTVVSGTFAVIQGSTLLNPSDNSDTNDIAYVDIVLQLMNTGDITISNVQVIGQTLPMGTIVDPTPLVYQQETIERNEDHLFHYYKNPLIYKQIPSYLVGWDFPLNPAQFAGSTIASGGNVNSSCYIWDQTILFQTAASGVSVARGPSNELQLTASATTQMAIVQYLDGPTVIKLLNDEISVNLSAVSIGQNIPLTISLWYTTDMSLPSAGDNPPTGASLITMLDANGLPSVLSSVNWVEIKRPLLMQESVATVTPSSTTNFNDYSFSGWNLNGVSAVDTATYFAIVIGTSSVTMGNSLNINSVSLCSGSLATRPAPQTPDEVLRACQYYYEKSYDVGVNPGTMAGLGLNSAITYPQFGFSVSGGGNTAYSVYPRIFNVLFSVAKRVIPTLTFYSNVSGVAGNVFARLRYGNADKILVDSTISTYWIQNISGTKAFEYITNSSSSAATNTIMENLTNQNIITAWIEFQYTADSRLGV